MVYDLGLRCSPYHAAEQGHCELQEWSFLPPTLGSSHFLKFPHGRCACHPTARKLVSCLFCEACQWPILFTIQGSGFQGVWGCATPSKAGSPKDRLKTTDRKIHSSKEVLQRLLSFLVWQRSNEPSAGQDK